MPTMPSIIGWMPPPPPGQKKPPPFLSRREPSRRNIYARPPPDAKKPRYTLATMSASTRPNIRQKKFPPPWRKFEHVELAEELRDLERDIAKHSTSQTPGAHDEQSGMQGPQTPQTGNPSSTRKRQRSTSTTKPAPRKKKRTKKPNLTKEIRDLERDITLHTTSQISGTPSWAKDGRSQRADRPSSVSTGGGMSLTRAVV
jgi:hypothetical protein